MNSDRLSTSSAIPHHPQSENQTQSNEGKKSNTTNINVQLIYHPKRGRMNFYLFIIILVSYSDIDIKISKYGRNHVHLKSRREIQ